jgi:predicted transcriptional regulator of viral defense system
MKQKTVIATAQALQQNGLYFFTSRTLAELLGLSKVQTSQLLRRMQAAGLAQRVERGQYLLLGLAPENVLSNPLYIGANLAAPGYVSFWSALHYYGFSDQAPRTTFVATRRRKPALTLGGLRFQFVTVARQAFFGYRREQHAGLPVVIADEEKTIIDCLMLPRYAGGMAQVGRALRYALERLDIARLVEYAGMLDSPSLGSRLGYWLEAFGRPASGLRIARGPVNLDPQRGRQGSYNARWRVYANLGEDELLPEEIG